MRPDRPSRSGCRGRLGPVVDCRGTASEGAQISDRERRRSGLGQTGSCGATATAGMERMLVARSGDAAAAVLGVWNLGQPGDGVLAEALVDRHEAGRVIQRREGDRDAVGPVVESAQLAAAARTEATAGVRPGVVPHRLAALPGLGQAAQREGDPGHHRAARQPLAVRATAGFPVKSLCSHLVPPRHVGARWWLRKGGDGHQRSGRAVPVRSTVPCSPT